MDQYKKEDGRRTDQYKQGDKKVSKGIRSKLVNVLGLVYLRA